MSVLIMLGSVLVEKVIVHSTVQVLVLICFMLPHYFTPLYLGGKYCTFYFTFVLKLLITLLI